jgi:hypothetical protein
MSRFRVDDLHEKWLQNPDYRAADDALEQEFSLASALIWARARAGLTQEQAVRARCRRPVIARRASRQARS